MDKKNIIKITNTVLNNVQKTLRRNISELEVTYVTSQLNKFISDNKNNIHELKKIFPIFMEILIDDLNNPEKIDKALAEPKNIDIHEMLKKEIEDTDKKKQMVKVKNSTDISSILGYSDSFNIRRLLDPSSLTSSSYIILDRKYRMDKYNNKKHSWQIAAQGQGMDQETSAISTTPLKNIIRIRMVPFRFPKSESAITAAKRLSILIEELHYHSYIAPEDLCRFHFMFTLTESGAGVSDPYDLTDSSDTLTEFSLFSKVQQIQTLSLKFGNPFVKFDLDPDWFQANITADGIQMVVDFGIPHKSQIGDYVVFSDVTTTQPTADEVILSFIKFKKGWPIIDLTATTATFNIDISDLNGEIVNPVSVYLESKRFIAPLQITFNRYD